MRWHKRFSADVIRSTKGIGADAIGAYNMIIDQIYCNGGPIDRSDKMLAALLGETDGKARKLTEKLLGLGLISLNADGQICDDFSENQLKNYEKLSENRKVSGKKGGENKKINFQKSIPRYNENNGLDVALATENPSKCCSKNVADIDKEIDIDKNHTSPTLEISPARAESLENGIDDDFEKYFDQCTDTLCQLGRNGNNFIPNAMMQTNTAWPAMVRKWYDSGFADQIMLALPECVNLAGGPIRSPNFFAKFKDNPVNQIIQRAEYQKERKRIADMARAQLEAEENERKARNVKH